MGGSDILQQNKTKMLLNVLLCELSIGIERNVELNVGLLVLSRVDTPYIGNPYRTRCVCVRGTQLSEAIPLFFFPRIDRHPSFKMQNLAAPYKPLLGSSSFSDTNLRRNKSNFSFLFQKPIISHFLIIS